MQPYNDYLSLFDLRKSDLASRKTLMSKKEEILLQFDLAQSTTIFIKDQEFDRNKVIQSFEGYSENIENIQLIRQIKGLNLFLMTGDFRLLDYVPLEKISPTFLKWIKPFMNHAYFLAGVTYIGNRSDLGKAEFQRVRSDLKELKKVFGGYHFEEAQQAIDQKWCKILTQYREQHHSINPPSKNIYLGVHSRVIKILTEFAYPYYRGRTEFDKFLIQLINHSRERVQGDWNKYGTYELKRILNIVTYLEEGSSVKMKEGKSLKENLELLVDQRGFWMNRNNVTILIVIVLIGSCICGFFPNLGSFFTKDIRIFHSNYDVASNTLELELKEILFKNQDESGDEFINSEMETFKKYFPDTTNFTLITRLKFGERFMTIRRKLVKDGTGYQILPVAEDSLFFNQLQSINYGLDAQEVLRMDVNYFVRLNLRLRDTKDIFAENIVHKAQFLITYRDSVSMSKYYKSNSNVVAGEEMMLGMLNDFYLLKSQELSYGKPLTIILPQDQGSYFYSQKDSVTLSIENGFDLETFFVIASFPPKKHIVYRIDRATHKVIEVDRKRWISRLDGWKYSNQDLKILLE